MGSEKIIVFVRIAMLMYMLIEINGKLYMWVQLLFGSVMTDLGKIILEFNTCTILVHICLE